MQSFLILLLSIAGLSWILVKSPLFKPFREYISREHIFYKKCVDNPHSLRFTINYKIYWFIDSLLNCMFCIGFWSAIVCYLLNKIHLEIVLFALSGTMVSGIIIGFINFLNRK